MCGVQHFGVMCGYCYNVMHLIASELSVELFPRFFNKCFEGP